MKYQGNCSRVPICSTHRSKYAMGKRHFVVQIICAVVFLKLCLPNSILGVSVFYTKQSKYNISVSIYSRFWRSDAAFTLLFIFMYVLTHIGHLEDWCRDRRRDNQP